MVYIKSALLTMALFGLTCIVKETPVQTIEGLLLVIIYTVTIPVFKSFEKK